MWWNCDGVEMQSVLEGHYLQIGICLVTVLWSKHINYKLQRYNRDAYLEMYLINLLYMVFTDIVRM